MVISSSSPPANPVGSFENFFRTFEETPGVFKYRQKITEMYSHSEHSLVVLFEDILNFDPPLANYLRVSPEDALVDAVEALKNILRFEAGGNFNADEDYFVRIATRNNSNEVRLRDIRAEHIDKLIYVKGIVIRASNIRPEITQAAFQCPICNNITFIPQTGLKLQEPQECSNPNCNNKKNFEIRTDLSTFIDYQIITLQEFPEELEAGHIPKTLVAILRNDIVGAVNPGQRVKVMGIFKSVPQDSRKNAKSKIFNTHLKVVHIEGLKGDEEEEDISDDDIREILALAKEPDIQKKIARSIAPSILGRERLKMAAALSLFGGNRKVKQDGTYLRGDIHVLFIGDPGTGKSQILQNCARIAYRSIYTSGKGASAAGLTAAVVKENDNAGMQLEAGALVLASGGVACIDEFDKMREQDRSAIHEAMEQQTVSIAKAGIVATLQSQTAIIAAANPKTGRWDDYLSPLENIDLSPPIRSRFDLILKVRDIPNKIDDDRVADHILRNHMEGLEEMLIADNDAVSGEGQKSRTDDIIPLELLQKYIRYAKSNCHPRLTPQAAMKIKEFYVNMRNSNPNSKAIALVARNLESIVRMSEAYAKMALKDQVTVEDVEHILELELSSLRDIGYDEETQTYDIDMLQTGTSTHRRKKSIIVKKILNFIKNFQAKNNQPFTFEDIAEPLVAEGIDEEIIREALDEWVDHGTLYQPTNDTYSLVQSKKKNKNTFH